MLLTKLTFGIDWKHKTFHIYHDDDSAEQVVVDDNGNGELLLDIFKSLNMAPLKGFIEELDELLTKEQKQAIFLLWGNSKQIMLSDMNRVVDKILAKQILGLGMDRGVLTRGVNSTWKVIDKEIQKTMKEAAERMKRGPIKGAPSFEESKERLQKQGFSIGEEKEVETVKESTQKSLSRYAEQAKKLGLKGFENHAKEEEGMVANRSMIEKHEMQHEETVEIVPELPLKKVSKIDLEVMKQDVKDIEELKEQMRSGIVAETTKCNEHMLNDKIKTLKVQIANAEIIQLQGQYTQGVKITASGSITKVERVEQRGVQKKESDTFHVSQKKIPTKAKPSPRSPVVKKK